MNNLAASSNSILDHIISFADLPSKINYNLVNKHCKSLVEHDVAIAFNAHRIGKFFPNEVINHIVNFIDLPDKLNFRLICKNFGSCLIDQKKTLNDIENIFKRCVNKHKENEAKKAEILNKQLKLSSQINRCNNLIEG